MRGQVLVVDEDTPTRHGLADALRASGYEVSTCGSFQEARTHLQSHAIDALVTDIRLREYNGLHLLHLTRTFHPGARVVVITGHPDDVLKRDAEVEGAGYLVKPVDPSELLGRLTGPTPGERIRRNDVNALLATRTRGERRRTRRTRLQPIPSSRPDSASTRAGRPSRTLSPLLLRQHGESAKCP